MPNKDYTQSTEFGKLAPPPPLTQSVISFELLVFKYDNILRVISCYHKLDNINLLAT